MPVKLMTVALASLVFMLSAGCFTAEEKNALPPGNNENHIFSVEEVYKLADSLSLHQESISVQGEFMGWQGCSGKTKMLTRSDWVLSSDNGCILVTGDFPDGLHPRNKKDLGKTVTIKAVVIHQDESVNLKHLSP